MAMDPPPDGFWASRLQSDQKPAQKAALSAREARQWKGGGSGTDGGDIKRQDIVIMHVYVCIYIYTYIHTYIHGIEYYFFGYI